MKLSRRAHRMRIYTGEKDKISGRPAAEVIVEEAKKHGLAGSTVLRGVVGYGANSRMHSSKILRLSEDLPLIIEIVDEIERLESFFPYLDEVIKEGLITIEETTVMVYRHSFGKTK